MTTDETKQAQDLIDSVATGAGELAPCEAVFPAVESDTEMDAKPSWRTYEERFPWIEWRRPTTLHCPDHPGTTWLGCRFCIGYFGLKASEIDRLPYVFRTHEEFQQHLDKEHGKP